MIKKNGYTFYGTEFRSREVLKLLSDAARGCWEEKRKGCALNELYEIYWNSVRSLRLSDGTVYSPTESEVKRAYEISNMLPYLREQAGLTYKAIEREFGIPALTYRSWETGVRQCPEYVYMMVMDKLKRYIAVHSMDEKKLTEYIRENMADLQDAMSLIRFATCGGKCCRELLLWKKYGGIIWIGSDGTIKTTDRMGDMTRMYDGRPEEFADMTFVKYMEHLCLDALKRTGFDDNEAEERMKEAFILRS